VDEGIGVYRPTAGGNLHWYAGRVPGLRGLALSARYLEHGWSWYRLLERLHRRDPFDVVEFAEGGDFWHAFRPSFPVVTNLHGSRFTFLKQSSRPVGGADWRHRKLELGFIRRARHVFSPSRSLLELVRREIGGAMPPADVLPLPLDPRLLESAGGAEGSEGGSPLVLFAARNDPVKGASVLLGAVPLVRRRVPDASFLLLGPQPPPGAHCPEGVRCLPFMPKDQLLAYYRRAALCVVPSLWDNSPNTIYEAMAAGRAVVASRVGGIPELVVDGQTGLLVPPGDPGRLAEAITRLLLEGGRREEMGREGRRRIQGLAGLEQNVRQRLAVYEKVAGRRGACPEGRTA
jgi:glycosyltransferase involved in cell wall biosynthesis